MNIVIERHGRVAVVRLNRPQARNALNSELMREMVSATQALDRDAGIGCIVIAGAETYFAAGADIREMHQKSYLQMVQDDFFAGWDAFAAVRTPKIAAVAGYAFGGGCELAMMCDTIYAGESARFGQPEITLGVMPGMGGSQRLTKLVGKSVAMDMILTGRQIDAAEAQRSGLVARVIPDARLMAEALEAAQRIASFSKTAAMAARDAVDRALETGLRDGLLFERRTFHALFATADQKEGMQAFLDKRPAVFNND
ncbi:Enoyl-CoA hydratase [Caballeronia glathei]|uniref:enoyl-CoA hydratase n=1 Tax=Caballeronia glathei TaxID=60547 RepID=A0A069PIC9_9BURK|nr:enoyl-CoA hydratase-related protein [Caballeronia glathei]KDR39634.1 enoyl-CoA hydratase [Caballeronia glathei]CDY77884.1 Enoyl-CoA hydratase [Caballeronia glathei]